MILLDHQAAIERIIGRRMSLWLDCSGSYAIVPSAQQVADLRALGFEGAIVGTSWSRAQALAQLSAFQSGGMRTQEYQFPSALRPPQGGWWIDAELPDATMITLRNAMNAGARGPYSRKGWADENQPQWNCKAEFPEAELWDARYVHGDVRCLISEAIATGRDVAAAIAAERAMTPPFRPYWGFTKAKITQWHNSITICGVNMDLNEYEEDIVTPAEKDEIVKRINDHTTMKLIALIGWMQKNLAPKP